jgi:HD superfamily phosphohydrolase
VALLDTPEVQRLRRIKQLGFTELVYPAANHSRLAHSLGVLHVARRMLDHFDRQEGRKLEEGRRMLVLAAALLHDVGHGPFSHAFEKVTGQSHEAYTLEIIQDPGTEVNQVLRRADPQLPERLALILDKTVPGKGPGPADPGQAVEQVPGYLRDVVSSQLDADRCDYLLRDSHATGTNYGTYDLSWLIAQLRVQEGGGGFYLSHKALSTVEAYLFARLHMFRTVYFHKTTRAAEVMLGLLFRRYKELLQAAGSDSARRGVVPEAPAGLIPAFGGGTMPLGAYLALDDHTITEFLKACERASDPVLQALGGGLLHRRLFKVIDATDVMQAGEVARVSTFERKVREYLEGQQIAPGYHFTDDQPSDTPYKPHNPDAPSTVTPIYVADATGKLGEISTRLETVAQLGKKYVLVRYYFSPQHRRVIEALAQDALEEVGS